MGEMDLVTKADLDVAFNHGHRHQSVPLDILGQLVIRGSSTSLILALRRR